MTARKVNVNGIVTFWNTSQTDVAKLRDAALAVDPGLDKYLPNESTPLNALKRGLDSVFPSNDYLIRRVKGDGFEVVREIKGETGNSYEPVCTAIFDEQDIVHIAGVPFSREQEIHAACSLNKNICEPGTLGNCLSEIVAKYFGGTSLRPATGGVYWLPDTKVDQWNALTRAIESASINGNTSVHSIRHDMDDQAIRAVHMAISAELADAAKRLHDDITTGDLGQKALESRERTANDLIGKARAYEDMLGVTLANATASLNAAKEAAAAAALLASVAADETAQAVTA